MKVIKPVSICIKNKKNETEEPKYQILNRNKYALFFSDDNVVGN